MERCKHCGEIIDRSDFLYCPACGKLLSAEAETEKEKKNREKKEKISANVKSGTRKSYIVFGIFSLVIGIVFLLASGYRALDLENAWFGGLFEKLAKTIKIDDVSVFREFLYYSVCAFVLLFIYIVSWLSVFSKRRTSGHVMIKISIFISMLFYAYIVIESWVHSFVYFLYVKDSTVNTSSLQNLFETLNKWNNEVCLGVFVTSLITFVVGATLSVGKFGHPYNTTFYQYFKSLFFIIVNLSYLLFVLEIGTSVKVIEKIYTFIFNSLPYYMIIVAFIMFFSAKMKKVKRDKKENKKEKKDNGNISEL